MPTGTPKNGINKGRYEKGHISWSQLNPDYMKGEKHWNWKNGATTDREYRNKYQKEYRNKRGKHYVQAYNNNRREKTKNLNIKTIQLVYEDNIKKYGTLTCYLCEKPIPFGKDHLEHKTPLSRGGTNLYENLEIACQSCNYKKHTKTEAEYRKENKI